MKTEVSCLLNVKTILYIDIEEEMLNVVIKYQSTEPIIYLKVKELKRKKTFKRNKIFCISTHLPFVSIAVMLYKHATKGLPLLMNNTLCCSASELCIRPLSTA